MGNGNSCVCDSDGLTRPSFGARGFGQQDLPSAPDIEMTAVSDGTRLRLREFLAAEGCNPIECARPTVLQFYASWCGGSHKAADVVESLSEEYRDERINFVHICVDGDGNPAAAAARFHHNHAIGRNGSFHFYVDQENDRLAAELYDISYLPHKVLVGRDGTVAQWDCREERPDLEAYLDGTRAGSILWGSGMPSERSLSFSQRLTDRRWR